MVCFLSLSSAALQTSHSAGHRDQFMIMTGGINSLSQTLLVCFALTLLKRHRVLIRILLPYLHFVTVCFIHDSISGFTQICCLSNLNSVVRVGKRHRLGFGFTWKPSFFVKMKTNSSNVTIFHFLSQTTTFLVFQKLRRKRHVIGCGQQDFPSMLSSLKVKKQKTKKLLHTFTHNQRVEMLTLKGRG